MAKTKRKWIVLDWSNPGCLRAQDIPFDATSSIFTTIKRGELKVSSTDTTLKPLYDKLSAGTGISLTKLNSGSDEQVQISATAASQVVEVENTYLDDEMTGVDSGAAFSMIDSIDFSPTEDGAIWFTVLFNNVFSSSSDVTLNFDYVPNGDISSSKNVRLNFKVWIVDNGDSPSESSPDINSNLDLSIAATDTGKFKEKGNALTIQSSNFNSDTKILLFKMSRLSTDSNDTYGGTLQVAKIYLKQ